MPWACTPGDSFCVAPMLTIAPDLQKRLQKHSYDIVEAIKVVGGTNIQFAHDPKTDRVVVIEINPRTSRSSALASKATGFPIAMVSSMLAAGLTLDEIPYWRCGTLEKYEPWGDYVVVKFSRWAFEKFRDAVDKLGTQMRAVGEVMSIGKTYKEALQKAIRSLENGRHGLGFAKDFNRRSLEDLLAPAERAIQRAAVHSLRGAAQGRGHPGTLPADAPQAVVPPADEGAGRTRGAGPCASSGKDLPDDLLVQAKQDGFRRSVPGEASRRAPRMPSAASGPAWRIVEGWDAVRVSGVRDAAYYYSTYNAADATTATAKRKVMVLGGGPNRIGQGIEFDYCCVHAAFALRDEGIESIMVNCNPETVSTDYDTSDKLYFEPLTVEDVLAIYQKEKPEGVIVQFGGQTPLNIARQLDGRGREDPGHYAADDRPGGGPRPVPRRDAPDGHPDAQGRGGAHGRKRPWRWRRGSAIR